MFISRKRQKPPKFIDIDSVKIETVEQFKLLGVIVDNKLRFNAHVAHQCMMINKKLYMIKRLFHLPSQVKLQFFKSFILPYFDYAISLCVYFHKNAIRKLCKSYYLCLLRLFRFKCDNRQFNVINDSLKIFGLFSFHHRLIFRVAVFLQNIVSRESSPCKLREWLKPVETRHHHNLRSCSRVVIATDRSKSSYGDFTFKSIFSKIMNTLGPADFDCTKNEFRNKLSKTHFDSYLNTLLVNFPKFNCISRTFIYTDVYSY